MSAAFRQNTRPTVAGRFRLQPPVAKTEFIAYRTKQQHAAGRLIGIDYDFILIFHTAEIG